MDIGDGDLVRLTRDGDPTAFRLLVERHLPMARARAARLCPQPDDADDAVQDAFLQAFIALDRLRDPGRFAGWLGGIVVNVCRAVDDPLMDRLAEPVTSPDPLAPFRGRQQAPPGPPEHTRFEPRNLAFTEGLHRWRLDGTFLRQAGFHDQDYSCTTEDGRVILAAAVPGPAGFAVLSQEIEPDDYRGRTVTFRADLRTTGVADRAGLVLRIPRQGRRPAPPDPWHDPENHFATVTGTRGWTHHEVTAQVPANAISITFGVFLNGRGQIELRTPELEPGPR